jgi:hypothetical protein
MTSRTRRWLVAALIGCGPVLFAARELQSPTPSYLTRTVLAPVPLVVSLVPLNNIGTPDRPVYEGTPAHAFLALASVPMCALIYTLVAYVMLLGASRLFRGVA